MRRCVERRNLAHPEAWRGRIGIHSGPIIGSVVSVQKHVYDIFGPGANLASRMQTLAEPMPIVVSPDTYALLRDDFSCRVLIEVEVKGFGSQVIYALEGEATSRFG